MILADTSIWIQHLWHGLPEMSGLLEQERVLIHPLVLGEVACGTMGDRERILSDLKRLPSVPQAHHDEVLQILAQEKLWGRGLGWIDLHLLLSARLGQVSLWTLDKALARAAAESGLEFQAD